MADKIQNVRIRYIYEGQEDLSKMDKDLKNLSKEEQNIVSEFKRMNNEAAQAAQTIQNNTAKSVDELKKEYQQLKAVSKNAFDLNQLKGYQAQMEKLELEAKQLGASLKDAGEKGKKALVDFDSAGKKVAGAIAGYFAVSKVIETGKAIVETTAKFQKFEAVLTNTLGSKSGAQKALQDIKQFAASTPFAVDELTDSYVKLANQGFKPTIEQMRNLGDLASSQGKSFDQLTEAIIDAQAGEFERLKEFGIRARKEGDNVKFTFKEVETQTKMTNESIRDYILSLGKLEGVSGGMAAISRTLGGQISNLGDSFDALYLSVGDRFSSVISDSISAVGSLVSGLTELIEVPVSEKLEEERIGFNALVTQITSTNQGTQRRKELIDQLNTQYKDYLPNLITEKTTNEELAIVQKKVNDQLLQRIVIQQQNEKVTEAANETAKKFSEYAEVYSSYARTVQREAKAMGIEQKLVGKTFEEQIQILEAHAAWHKKGQYFEILKNLKHFSDEVKVSEQEYMDVIRQKEDALKILGITEEKQVETTQKQNKETEKEVNSIKALEEKLKQLIITRDEKTDVSDVKAIRALNLEIKTTEELIKKLKGQDEASKELEKRRKAWLEMQKEYARVNKELSSYSPPDVKTEYDIAIKNDVNYTTRTKEEAKKRHETRVEEMKKYRKEVSDPMIAIREERYKKEKEIEELDKQNRQRVGDEVINLGFTVANGLFEMEKEKNARSLANLQTEKEKELQLVGDNKQAQAFINKKYADQEKELKRKQAKIDFEQALFNIGAQTAVNVVRAYGTPPVPNVPLATVTGALGLAQLAFVASKGIPKYNTGTEYVPGVDVGNKDSVLSYLTVGEAVIPREQNKKYRPIVSGIIDGTLDPNIFNSPSLNYSKFDKIMIGGGGKVDNSSLERKLDKINRTLENLPVTKVEVSDKGIKKFIQRGMSESEFTNDYFKN
jgi:hypothetical protein